MVKTQRVVITPGEPAGIGPDLVVQLAQREWPVELVVCADATLLTDRAAMLGLPLTLRPYSPNSPAQPQTTGTLTLLPVALREYDDEERTYVVLNDHTWIFEAKTQLTDFYKIAKVDEDEFERVVGDADTLAGMLLEIKGEFPALHEKVTYHNYEFEVLEMDSRRILKVKFTILPKEETEGAEDKE